MSDQLIVFTELRENKRKKSFLVMFESFFLTSVVLFVVLFDTDSDKKGVWVNLCKYKNLK